MRKLTKELSLVNPIKKELAEININFLQKTEKVLGLIKKERQGMAKLAVKLEIKESEYYFENIIHILIRLLNIERLLQVEFPNYVLLLTNYFQRCEPSFASWSKALGELCGYPEIPSLFHNKAYHPEVLKLIEEGVNRSIKQKSREGMEQPIIGLIKYNLSIIDPKKIPDKFIIRPDFPIKFSRFFNKNGDVYKSREWIKIFIDETDPNKYIKYLVQANGKIDFDLKKIIKKYT